MKIKVTAEDIRCGVAAIRRGITPARGCPVQRAITRTTGESCVVERSVIYMNHRQYGRLPDEESKRIRAFDLWLPGCIGENPMVPHEFELLVVQGQSDS